MMIVPQLLLSNVVIYLIFLILEKLFRSNEKKFWVFFIGSIAIYLLVSTPIYLLILIWTLI